MGVEFEENKLPTRTVYNQKKVGGIIGLVIKTGIAKTEQQANLILIGILIVCIIAIVVINFF